MNTTAAETRGSLNSGSITRSLSTGSCDNGDNSATVKQRKVPIYLRASTGSCHDVCKYGKGHAFEDKPKIPLRKRIAKPSLNEDTFIQILVLGEQNKDNVDAKKHSLNAKPSPRRPNARSPNSLTEKTPEIIKREITLSQDSIIDDKMSSSDQKTSDQLLKHPSSVKSKPVKAKPSDGVQPGGKVRASASASKSPLVPKSSLSKTASNKTTQSGRVKSSAPPRKDQHTSNSQVPEKIIHVIEIETGNNPLESAPENVSLSQEKPSEEVNGTDDFADNKTLVMETEKTILESSLDSHAPFPSSLKSSSHRRSPSSLSSSSKSSFHRRSPSSSSSSKSSPSHKRSPSSLSSSSKSTPSHRRSPSSLSSSSKSSPSHKRSPSSLSSSSKSSPSHRRSPSSSSKSSSSHSRSPSMTSVEVDEEIKHISKETDIPVSGKRTPAKGTPPRGNHNNNVRKIKMVSCDDKPVKLKFRSGKVLDPPQDNNNSNNNIARRLKFRRMREDGDKAEISVSHIQENTKTLRKSRVVVCEYKRRSPKRLFGGEKADNNMPLRLRFRRGRIIGADEGKGDSKRNVRNGGFEGANMKMKLKHQADLKGKKDGQCLFNNVIEETATKLAVSRKSKVLALVGAFETVISLHSPRA